ncbi:hypothetical protein ACFMBG_23670 [Leisingera sp. D0M16]|uniref:hypothetical protein n=1 Tax=Leisingera coralii TaxID=3351347 RepID=UPI003B81855E
MKYGWLIKFESGGYLSDSKKEVTYFGGKALFFECYADAKDYFMRNATALEETGLRPLVAQYSPSAGQRIDGRCDL